MTVPDRTQPHATTTDKIRETESLPRSGRPDQDFKTVGRVGLEPTTGGL
jgi:hypothetical protein